MVCGGNGKQFTLYNHESGLNFWKVCFVFYELDLEFNDIYLDFGKKEHKQPAYLALCPNGRIPCLVDHSRNDFVVWESNAILQYLVNNYDPEHKISVSDADEKCQLEQWLYFQASGQGPYFGQAQWFTYFHQEKLPSAIERYQKEIKRVFGVLESVLSQREWLVGGKCTIADLAFLRYNELAVNELLEPGFDFHKEFPSTAAWQHKLRNRESVLQTYEYKARLLETLPRDMQCNAW